MKRWNPILALIAICFAIPSFATHTRGGQISVRMITALVGEIKLTIYLNTDSPVPVGGGPTDVLYIWSSNGERVAYAVPEINKNMVPAGATYVVVDVARRIAVVEYVIQHTFQGNDKYTITYTETNRNENILNMNNSATTPLFLETSFTLRPDLEYHGTPKILAPPIFSFSHDDNTNNDFSLSLGASDPTDFTLYYKLRTPKSDINSYVLNYQLPENMKLNQFNGLLTWDGYLHDEPVVGEIATAVYVYQYKGEELIGYTMRDFQVIASEDDQVSRSFQPKSIFSENDGFHLADGGEVSFKVFAGDVNDVSDVEVFSELGEDNISISTYDSSDNKTKVGLVTVKHSEPIVRANPYNITVRARYDAAPVDEEKDLVFLVYTTATELAEPPLSIDDNVILAVEDHVVNLEVFPNPTSAYVIIEGSQSPMHSVKLQSASGRTTSVPFLGNQIDLRNVEPGLYILQLAFRNGSIKTEKVLKLSGR